MRLGELIAVARECKGWTLRDLEKASGVSNSLISQIETGKVKDPGFTTVVQIMDALDLKLDRAATSIRARRDVLREAEKRKPFGLSRGKEPRPPDDERGVSLQGGWGGKSSQKRTD